MGQNSSITVGLDSFFQTKSKSNVNVQSIMISHAFSSINFYDGRLMLASICSCANYIFFIGTVNLVYVEINPWNETVNLELL